MRISPLLVSIALGCIVNQSQAHTGTSAATCPSVTSIAVCHDGKWQVKATNGDSNWYALQDSDALAGKACANEGETLTNLQWGFAWSMYPGWGIMCRYYFAEKPKPTRSGDLTFYSNAYQVDVANNNWHFDYHWRWQCSQSQTDCTLS